MSPQEREYYRERAQAERLRAAQASSVAVEIHLELACMYEQLVKLEEQEQQPSLRVVAS